VPEKIAPEISTGFYRIFQEATTNIARHAAARCVCVKLFGQDGHLRLEITDDGSGIDLTAGRIGAIGVLGMTERARELGGMLKIGRPESGGTRLQVTVPLAPGGIAG
jgi:signal transduction histidine kinase